MDSPKAFLFCLPLLLVIFLSYGNASVSAQYDDSSFQITGETLNQWQTEMPFYDEDLGEDGDDDDILQLSASNRRSLFWGRAIRYYISYGALSANRIPCPPRSGRSYYTHNCYRASGPVHPYTRGCSAITRCRR